MQRFAELLVPFRMRTFRRTFKIKVVVPSQFAQPGFRRKVSGDDPALEILEVIAKIGRAREWSPLV